MWIDLGEPMGNQETGSGRKKFVIIDSETRRQTDAYGLVVPKYTPHPYNKDGVQVSRQALRDLALNGKLPKRALRIALWLICQVERNGGVHGRQSLIAEELDMQKSDVSRGLAELFKHGKNKMDDGRSNKPILPPGKKPSVGVRASAAWRGNAEGLIAAINKEKISEQKVLAEEILQASKPQEKPKARQLKLGLPAMPKPKRCDTCGVLEHLS